MGQFYFHEKLLVYQKARPLAASICTLAKSIPYSFSRIRDQLVGAAISVPLNIAEGTGRYNPKEKRQFYRMARASLLELGALLDICEDINILSPQDISLLRNSTHEVSRMLFSLAESSKSGK